MPLIRDGGVVEDRYLKISDEMDVPETGAVLVSGIKLLANPSAVLDRGYPSGVLWPNDRSVSELVSYLEALSLVALMFPTFKDGRAYSQARILRERYQFQGELRATGQVLRDQFLFLHRAGFDSFDVAKAADASAFVEALGRYSRFYQPLAQRMDQRAGS